LDVDRVFHREQLGDRKGETGTHYVPLQYRHPGNFGHRRCYFFVEDNEKKVFVQVMTA
jgi:hypothetical protein